MKNPFKQLVARAPRRPRPENLEEQIYDAIVRASDTCLDVGANRGDITERLALLAGADGLVVACEPVWAQYRLLCTRLARLPAHAAPVVPVPMGLSDRPGEARVHVPRGDFGQGSIAAPERWAAAQDGAALEHHDCQLTTLDALLAASRLPEPDVVKIDVEGAELLVLRGASALLARGARPLMLVELFAPWERAFGYGPWEPLSLLRGLGYRLLFVCPDGLVEHEPSAEAPFPAGYEAGYNVLAVDGVRHRERIDALAPLRRGGGGTLLPMQPPPLPNRP
jgi:FkbM family methyltransferase